MDTLPLRAALSRGALIVAANWPVVLIDFSVSSLYRLAMSVPVLGGSLVVATLLGTDPRSVIGEGVRSTADIIVGSLASVPVALLAFLVAIAIVTVGGEAVQFIVKTGTFLVLVRADRASGGVHSMPLGAEALERASAYALETVVDGARHFARRAIVLALWLGAGYLLIGVAYVAVVTIGIDAEGRWAWLPAWPLLVLVVTGAGAILMTVVRLAYDLLRVIVVTDDCSVRRAVLRLGAFAVEDARQVLGIFVVMGAVQVLAAMVALLATAGLAIVAYVPLVSLVFVPLQAAAWVLRGLLFESLALAALSAYQTQYRRFSDARRAR